MVVNDADSPPDLHVLDSFNFSPADLAPIASLHWAATRPDWSPPDLPLGETPAETDPPAAAEADESAAEATATTAPTGPKPPRRNNRESMKLKKRRATFEKAREARDDFFRGEFDGSVLPPLLIARSRRVQLWHAPSTVLTDY